jgi:immunity protein, SdpI family
MRSRWFGLVVAALAAVVSVWAYARLPGTVAMHWNLHGQPDGYSSRLWAVAAMPVFIVLLTGLFRILPKVDPKRANYEKFLDTYWLIANAVMTFAGVGHVLIIANGLGYTVQIDRLLPVGLGLLLSFLGNYMTRVEPNWFVGIRTPWTLSSDAVWRKTHRTAGWLLVFGGLAIAAGAFLPRPVFVALSVAVIAVACGVPVVQSYVLWRREQGQRA